MVKDGIDNTSVEGAADTPYAIPNLQVELHSPKNGVPVLWWRSVGHSHTAFVMESFLDDLAHKAGKDPYQYRRTLLAKHPRHLKVLQTAAEKAGWGKPLPKGRGRGIAVHESFGSFIAQVAEVSLDKNGSIKVHRVVCAVDCGRIVNPDTIKAQMESGIIFGLTAALYGAHHPQERPGRTGQFRQLSAGAHGRRAKDRGAYRCQQRGTGWCRRTGCATHRPGGGQCPLCLIGRTGADAADDPGSNQGGDEEMKQQHVISPKLKMSFRLLPG